jgi:hypothetical protein
MKVAPNTVPPAMKASDYTPRAGESADGSTEFSQYLQRIARAEVERATDKLQSDAFALAHSERPQVQREVSIDDLRSDVQEAEWAVRFLELAAEMEGAE